MDKATKDGLSHTVTGNPNSISNVVVRETIDGQSTLIKINRGSSVHTKQNADYSILDANTLTELRVVRTWRAGNNLNVELADGTYIVFLKHFLRPESDLDTTSTNHETITSEQPISQKNINENRNQSTLPTASDESEVATSKYTQTNSLTTGLSALGGAVALGGFLSQTFGASGGIINNLNSNNTTDDSSSTTNDSSNTTIDPPNQTDNHNAETPTSADIEQIKAEIAELQDNITTSFEDISSRLTNLNASENANDTLTSAFSALLETIQHTFTTLSSTPSNSNIVNNNIGPTTTNPTNSNTVNNNVGTSTTNPSNSSTINNNVGSTGTNGQSNPPPSSDTVAPTILETYSSSEKQYYTQGEKIPISLRLSESVSGTGSIQAISILMSDGSQALYESGVGTNILNFSYTVGEIDNTSLLDTVTLQLNGAQLVDAAGNPLNPLLGPQNTLSKSTSIFLEPNPFIEEIRFTAQEELINYNSDVDLQAIEIELNFSHPVTIAGDPTLVSLTLSSGGVAYYVSGAGTQNLLFKYEPSNGDTTDQLRVIGIVDDEAKVQGPHGAEARLNIGNGITHSYIVNGQSVETLQVDLDSPSIEQVALSNLDIGQEPQDSASVIDPITGETLEVWSKVTGTIIVKFTDDVFWQNSVLKPYLSLKNVLAFPPNLGLEALTATAEFVGPVNIENPIDTEFLFEFVGWICKDPASTSIEVDYLVRNNAIIVDASGNSARVLIDPVIVNTDIDVSPTLQQITVAAGRFDPKTVDIIAGEQSDSEKETDNHALTKQSFNEYVVLSAIDNNAEAGNYLDEFTGKIQSMHQLGSERNALRAIVSRDSVSETTTISPLTELAALAHQRQTGHPNEQDAHYFNQRVSEFFGISSITEVPVSFIYDDSFALHQPTADEFQYGIALALLSMMDSITGSLFSTIETLYPIFCEPMMTNDQARALNFLLEECSTALHKSINPLYQHYAPLIEEHLKKIANYVPTIELRDDLLDLGDILGKEYSYDDEFDIKLKISDDDSTIELEASQVQPSDAEALMYHQLLNVHLNVSPVLYEQVEFTL